MEVVYQSLVSRDYFVIKAEVLKQSLTHGNKSACRYLSEILGHGEFFAVKMLYKSIVKLEKRGRGSGTAAPEVRCSKVRSEAQRKSMSLGQVAKQLTSNCLLHKYH